MQTQTNKATRLSADPSNEWLTRFRRSFLRAGGRGWTADPHVVRRLYGKGYTAKLGGELLASLLQCGLSGDRLTGFDGILKGETENERATE